MTPRGEPLASRDLWKLALGVLALQSTFNTERRQGLGVAAAVSPLRRLFGGAGDGRRFLLRHMESFNTNPVLAGPLLGAVARLEALGAGGEPGAGERARKVKHALEAPFAALGDAFMWGALRPALLLWGGILAWVYGFWGPVVFLVLYNAVHLGLRVGGVFWGYHRAYRVQDLLRARWLRTGIRAGAWAVGSGVFLLSLRGWFRPGVPETLGLAGLVVGFALGRRGFTRGAFLALGGIFVGLVFSLIEGIEPR
jgi:mannose/fructose/N-acetylgalactosamine-specific phosphotransferase system component IID